MDSKRHRHACIAAGWTNPPEQTKNFFAKSLNFSSLVPTSNRIDLQEVPVPYEHDSIDLNSYDLLLVDIAQQLQLTNTEHENNRARYEALATFIDGPGSVLEDRVIDIFPSGSNAIDAAIRGLIKRDTPDVDAVIVLDVPRTTPPQDVLGLVKSAITRGGTDHNKYRDCKVEQHSRCITVTYADGSTVDLMPVVKVADDQFAPIMELFHFDHDVRPAVSYTKPISPIGFKNAVRRSLTQEMSSVLYEGVTKAMRQSRSVLLEKADVERFPDKSEFADKSPRIVVLQLLKRYRDILFRQRARSGRRKPPSVVLAALAIRAPFALNSSLTDELIHVASFINDELAHGPIDVRNPGFEPDIFTDRWPENGTNDQALLSADLDNLISELNRLKKAQTVEMKAQILKGLFGESVAGQAMKMQSIRLEQARQAGKLAITPTGSAIVSTSASRAITSSSERFGGKADETD